LLITSTLETVGQHIPQGQQIQCLPAAQTSLSESYNYRHLRTATNVSTIIHISTKTPARTRKNSRATQLSAPHRTPPPAPSQLVTAKGVVSIYELDQQA